MNELFTDDPGRLRAELSSGVQRYVREYFEQRPLPNVDFVDDAQFDEAKARVICYDATWGEPGGQQIVQLATARRNGDIDDMKIGHGQAVRNFLDDCLRELHVHLRDSQDRWLLAWPQAYVKFDAFVVEAFIWADAIQGFKPNG